MKKFLVMLLAAIQAVCLASCTAPTKDGNKLRVYTSFYAMYDFAKEIGGDKADVYLMCPPAQEAHDFEPTAKDIAALSQADIFVYNGREMEHWAERVAQNLGENVSVVETSKNIKSENADPHVWLNPDNAYLQYEAIADAFKNKDSENADYYDERLINCKKKLSALKSDYTASDLSEKYIIVSHDAYSHLCDVLAISQYAVNGTDNSGDATPSKMAETELFIKENDVKYIFAEPDSTSDIMQTIAGDCGCEILILDPFEKGTNNKDYFTVMYDNLSAIKKALG